MDLLYALIAASCVLLLSLAPRHIRRRRLVRLNVDLAEVEAASALVIADWPCAHTSARLEGLALERLRRSASYRQGWHTATSREADYLVLQRIGNAEERLRRARDLSLRTPVRTGDHS